MDQKLDSSLPTLLVAPGRAGSILDELREVVRTAGATVAADGDVADGVIWLSGPEGLAETLAAHPGVRWVQLPWAGIERVVEAGVVNDPRFQGITWTSAKGAYAKPVAEHALALALAGLRDLPTRARARSWGQQSGISLYGADVTILGGGGITEELLRLLAPFGTTATVVRRKKEPVAGAARVVTSDQLESALPGALVVFLALALVRETIHVIGARQLALMSPASWLVNVARGRHVDTGALVEALRAGRIGGAALDVTDPEPLPEGHPLWSLPNCLITPHTADTHEMIRPMLAQRVKDNIERFALGEPLVGTVDPIAGY